MTNPPSSSREEQSRTEGARVLLNEARGALKLAGIDDEELLKLAERFRSEEQTADVGEFVAWVTEHRHAV